MNKVKIIRIKDHQRHIHMNTDSAEIGKCGWKLLGKCVGKVGSGWGREMLNDFRAELNILQQELSIEQIHHVAISSFCR